MSRSGSNRSGSKRGARRVLCRRPPLIAVLIAVAVVLAGVGVVVATSSGGDGPSGDNSSVVGGGGTDAGATLEPAPADTVPPDERSEAPGISGDGLEGHRISLADFKGKPVVVVEFASWCEICREEARAVAEVAKKNPQVQFVGLNVEDSPEAAREFMAEYDWPPMPVIEDPDRSLAGAFGLYGQPNTVAIDAKGGIAATHEGGATADQLEGLVDAART